MAYTETELHNLLTLLRNEQAENEVFEFKEAKNDYNFEKIGKYFSALGLFLEYGIKIIRLLVRNIEPTVQTSII